MIVQDTIEGRAKYAMELIQRIHRRQKIESSDLITYKSGKTSGWDINFSSAEGEQKKEFWRVSFYPTHGGTPYTEFDIYMSGDAGIVTHDDSQMFGNRVTIIIYLIGFYSASSMSVRVNARSVDTGTITVEKL